MEFMTTKEAVKKWNISERRIRQFEWTYNSNSIEGNTLSLRETQEKAILYLNDIVKENNPITEWNIKSIHQLVLKNIDDD